MKDKDKGNRLSSTALDNANTQISQRETARYQSLLQNTNLFGRQMGNIKSLSIPSTVANKRKQILACFSFSFQLAGGRGRPGSTKENYS
jgi:hypothetical protein